MEEEENVSTPLSRMREAIASTISDLDEIHKTLQELTDETWNITDDLEEALEDNESK